MLIEFLEVDSAANETPLCFDPSKPIHGPPVKDHMPLDPCKYRLNDGLSQCQQPLLLRIVSLRPLALDHCLVNTDAYLAASLVPTALSAVRACSILTTLIDTKFIPVAASHLCLDIDQTLSMGADTAVVLLVIHKPQRVIWTRLRPLCCDLLRWRVHLGCSGYHILMKDPGFILREVN